LEVEIEILNKELFGLEMKLIKELGVFFYHNYDKNNQLNRLVDDKQDKNLFHP